MLDVAILGAGEIGGSLAYVLARRRIARSVRLIDPKGQVAAGKALDIQQVAPVEGFATMLSGATDLTAAAGAHVLVIADQAASGGEWSGDEAFTLVQQISRLASQRPVLCAGASHRPLIERAVREAGYAPQHILGSAPEALAAALRALVALAAGVSALDVGLTVLGAPPSQAVVPWDDVSIGGLSATRMLDEPTRRGLAARVAALWPPGPYALANAAAECIAGMTGRSQRVVSAFVAADHAGGARARTVALPVRLDLSGVRRVEPPALTANARVALDNAMLL